MRFDASTSRVQVYLRPDFQIEDWTEIEQISHQQLNNGCIHWSVFLTELHLLTSRLLGLLIGLNAILDIRGGSLELVTRTGAAVERVLQQANLARIVTIRSVE